MKAGGVTEKDSSHGLLKWIPAVMTVSALSAMLFVAARFPLNADVAWFMTMGRGVLNGGRLYETLIDVNPPLIVYAMIPVVALSDLTGLSDSASLIFVFTITASLIVVWSIRLLGFRWSSRRTLWWTVLLVFAFLIVPAWDFGQREHLMLLLVLPFVLFKWKRVGGGRFKARSGVAIGVLAGLGFAIKPYFLLFWLFLELFDWFRTRDRGWRVRPESVAVVLVHAAYVLVVIVRQPEYLPMMAELAPIYSQFSADKYRLIFIGYFALPLLLVLVARASSRTPEQDLVDVFLVVACAGLLVALFQGKGWRYHSLPMIVTTVIAWGALFEQAAVAIAERVGSDRLRASFVLSMLLICAYPLEHSLSYALDLADRSRSSSRHFEENVASYSPGSLLVFGDVVNDAFPLTNSVSPRSIPPFPSMWWLRVLYGAGGSYQFSSGEPKHLDIERKLRRILVDHFVSNRPDIVLVDTLEHARFAGGRFPYIEYFGQETDFARAWRGYTRVGTSAHFEVWRAVEGSDQQRAAGLR